jgi:hypothetical protein
LPIGLEYLCNHSQTPLSFRSPTGVLRKGAGGEVHLSRNRMIENADVRSLFRVSYFGTLANQTGSH